MKKFIIFFTLLASIAFGATEPGNLTVKGNLVAGNSSATNSLLGTSYAENLRISDDFIDILETSGIKFFEDGGSDYVGFQPPDSVASSLLWKLPNADATDQCWSSNGSGVLNWRACETASSTKTFTNTTFDADGTGNSITNIENADIKAGAAIDRTKLANGSNYRVITNNGSGVMADAAAITADRVLVSDANGIPAHSSVTTTEAGYLSGVTSAIQTQINTKAPTASPTFTGTITTPLTASRAVVTGASSELAVSTTTATEIGYVAGATSNIQNQINSLSVSAASTSVYDVQNLGLAFSVGSSALTIALKQADGATDPAAGAGAVKISFESVSTTDGAYENISITSATSVVVPSGATLGCNSGSNCYIYVYAVNNAGTVYLGVSATWIADGINATYSLGTGSDTSTDGPYHTGGGSGLATRMIARLRYSTAPNGTYSATPSAVNLGSSESLRMVGQIIAANSSVKTMSASNTWSDMTNNSITIQPGRYKISGDVNFSNGGSSPGYSQVAFGIFGADGADSSSTPTALSATTGVTIISASAGSGFASATDNITATIPSSISKQVNPIVIDVNKTVTLYPVPYATMTTAANTRVTTAINAERVY